MPVSRPKKVYGAGESKYPIKPGAVFRLNKTVQKRNPKLKGIWYPHYCVIWVQTIAPIPKYRRPKTRKVTICRLWLPKAEDLRRFYLPRKRNGEPDRGKFVKKIRFDSLVQVLRDGGYTKLGTIEYGKYKKLEFRRFFQLIGLL